MYHSRSLSEEITFLPLTLSAPRPHDKAAAASDASSSLETWPGSPYARAVPSTDPASPPYLPPLSLQRDQSAVAVAWRSDGEREQGVAPEPGPSSDITPLSNGFGPPRSSPKRSRGTHRLDGGGMSDYETTASDYGDATKDSAQEWYARTFGGPWTMSSIEPSQAVAQVELIAQRQVRRGEERSERAQPDDFFALSNEYDPLESPLDATSSVYHLSPLSDSATDSTYDCLSVEPSCSPYSNPRRATYGMDSPLASSPESPLQHRHSGTAPIPIATSGPYSQRYAEPTESFFPSYGFASFSAASTALSQSPPVSLQHPPSLPGHPRVLFGAQVEHSRNEFNSAAPSSLVDFSIKQARRASTQGHTLSYPRRPAIDNRRLSCPAPAPLGPVPSPHLGTLPCPSPNFALDGGPTLPRPSASVPPARFELAPPFEASLVDLPPLPVAVASETMALPTPPPLPESSPPSSARRRPQKPSKRRHSSSSSSSLSPSSPASSILHSPRTREVPAALDTSTDAIDHDSAHVAAAADDHARKISPITGKPTRTIAKRSWPPKDAALRRFACPIVDCDKTFGRPSALNTHMRTHDGRKPFECPVPSCARPFSVFSNLKRHMVVHPSVDFRCVTVNDMAQIRWRADANDPGGEGGRLEWIDDDPGQGQGSDERAKE
ncbi:hypothetical protein JCM3766R1_002013 [Sporobolomyces carnicolor]